MLPVPGVIVQSVLVLLASSLVAAQYTSKGQCASFDSKTKFSLPKYFSGRWYVVEGYRSKNMYMSACHQFQFKYDKKYLYINESLLNMGSQKSEVYLGKAKYFDKTVMNHFRLIPGIKTLPYGTNMWIIATDYNEYGVVYFCAQITNEIKQEYLYILSRQKTLSDIKRMMAVRVIAESGFPVKLLAPEYQLKCPDFAFK